MGLRLSNGDNTMASTIRLKTKRSNNIIENAFQIILKCESTNFDGLELPDNEGLAMMKKDLAWAMRPRLSVDDTGLYTLQIYGSRWYTFRDAPAKIDTDKINAILDDNDQNIVRKSVCANCRFAYMPRVGGNFVCSNMAGVDATKRVKRDHVCDSWDKIQ